MATLVLTTVGTLIGGPIGGAIGALIGNGIDNSLLGNSGSRTGSRLADLAVQTSSYGSAIPRLFGTMRVAGTVIWATDLIEDSHSSGGGKSSPKTTTYSYSANLAVALSGRPIEGVGRIWANGTLLRGSAGDWKTETGFRLYLGDEDQAADPLIASAEGAASAPAHRGLAYAVFEGLQLADYGNAIPSLTFEITADASLTSADIAAELSGGAIAGSGGSLLAGYAASGDTIRAALDTLAQACPMALCDDGRVLQLSPSDLITIPAAALGAATGDDRQPAQVADRQSAATLPDEIAVAYYDPARDYQSGLQRARRDGIGQRAQAIDLPASLSADGAKSLAEAALARAWAARSRQSARLPWRWLEARAGARAVAGGSIGRVTAWSLETMVLTLTLAPDGPADLALTASPGRATLAPDAVAGTTVLALLDLPPLSDTPADTPQLRLAAAGTAPGWRRAEASLSLDGGARWQALGRTAMPAVIGSAATVLGDGPRDRIDRRSAVEVDLRHAGMALQSAAVDALVGSANAAMLGDELIQFGSATQLSPTRWRLSTLLRGRRGSDWAIAGHAAGERFVLLDEGCLLAIDLPVSALGTTVTVRAIGPGDGGVAIEASAMVVGGALRPPAPVHLAAARQSDGAIRIDWVRRSRIGWAWLDGTDAPLGEDAEAYRLTITPSAGAARTVDSAAPGYLYTAAAQAADGAAGASSLAISLVQIGTRAASSPPATATFHL